MTGAPNEYDSTSLATYGYEWDRLGRLTEANQAGDMFGSSLFSVGEAYAAGRAG